MARGETDGGLVRLGEVQEDGAALRLGGERLKQEIGLALAIGEERPGSYRWARRQI